MADDGEWSPQINLGVPVLIPEAYVPDLDVRLGLYRRLSALEKKVEMEGFAAELIDRFGPLPAEVDTLMLVVRIKALCKRAGIAKLDGGPKGATVQFHNDKFANPAGLVQFLNDQQRRGEGQGQQDRGPPRLGGRRRRGWSAPSPSPATSRRWRGRGRRRRAPPDQRPRARRGDVGAVEADVAQQVVVELAQPVLGEGRRAAGAAEQAVPALDQRQAAAARVADRVNRSAVQVIGRLLFWMQSF